MFTTEAEILERVNQLLSEGYTVLEVNQLLTSTGNAVNWAEVNIPINNGTEIAMQQIAVPAAGGFATVGAAVASIAPPVLLTGLAGALGLSIGSAIYNADQTFWQDLVGKLAVSAGALFDSDGSPIVPVIYNGQKLFVHQSVVDSYISTLYDYGYFEYNSENELSEDIWSRLDTTIARTQKVYGSNIELYQSNGVDKIIFSLISGSCSITPYFGNSVLAIRASSQKPFTIQVSIQRADGSTNPLITSAGVPYTSGGLTVYGNSPIGVGAPVSALNSDLMENRVKNVDGNIVYADVDSRLRTIDFIAAYGDVIISGNPNIYSGATPPNAQTVDIPSYYPNWERTTFPSEWGLPSGDYFNVPLPGVEQQTQTEYQTADPQLNPDILLQIIQSLADQPTVIITDFPTPSEDTDTQSEIEAAPANPGSTSVPTDPPNPNPEPTPDTSPVPTVSPATQSGGKLFTVYSIDQAILDSLGEKLWSNQFEQVIKNLWYNPMSAFIGMHNIAVNVSVGALKNIWLGAYNTEVQTNVITQQYVDVNCGTVSIPQEKYNILDFPPFVSLDLFLPFIGIVPLDPHEIIGGTVSVTYHVDVWTGSCIAEVSVLRSPDVTVSKIFYQYSGNCAQSIPLTSADYTGMLSSIKTAALGGVSAGTSIAFGHPGAALAAGVGTLLGTALNNQVSIQHGGSISGNPGMMGQRIPYIIVKRQAGYDANGYNNYYGYPCNYTGYIGNSSGFTRVKAMELVSAATQAEKDEIEQLCKDGIIV